MLIAFDSAAMGGYNISISRLQGVSLCALRPHPAGIHMFAIRHTTQRVSHRITRRIGIHFGEAFPFWYIVEFPRSGDTWLGRMVADYLDIPFSEHSVLPVVHSCVNFAHWRYHRGLRRCLYIHRDGRDVMTSLFFYWMNRMQQKPQDHVRDFLRRRFDRAFGPGFDPEDSVGLMARFIELEMTRPRIGSLTWPRHIACWLGHDHVAYLSYEALVGNTAGSVGAALESFLDEPLDRGRLDEVVERYSFRRMSGRERGDEDRRSFLRRGTVGNWREHFCPESAEVFDHYAGQTLIELGYEPDRSWLARMAIKPLSVE